MGIVLGDNIDYKGKKPLDSRMLFDTIADMKAYSENYLPDITLAFNKEDSKMYVFNRENDVDEDTGKWRIFESGEEPQIAVEDLTNYNEDENRVEEQYMVMKRNITTQKWDKLPENSLQDKSGTYSFNNYDVAGKYWFNSCIVSDGHPAMLNLDGQGKVHGVLEVFEAYSYNQTATSGSGIVFQRFTTTNSGQQLQFTRRKAFGHSGTWGAWTMEQTNRQSVNRGKTYAFFGGSVCYNWNPLSGTAADNYAIEEILGVNSIRKRAISGAGWVAGNKIDNQITTELAEANPADVWVFWSSTNDHTAQVPIGDLDHKTDTTTVIGAMCNAIERVRTAKPTANILMTTPIRRFNNESGWNPYYDDGTTIPFYKYAEAVYTVANYYGIPVFDLWNNSGIDIKNYTTYMSDTIHPNANGYKLFQRELCKFCADGHTGNSMPVIKDDGEGVDYVYKDGYFVLGNIYVGPTFNATKNRIALVTPVEIDAGVEIKTKTGRQMGIYTAIPDPSMTNNNSWDQATPGWVTSYTTQNQDTYYFAFKKNDNSDFVHVDYTVEDVLDVEDYTPFKEKVVEQPSVWKDKVAVFVGDSITAGSGATSGKLYYNYLQQMLGLKEVHVNAEGGRCVSVTSDYGTQHTPLTTQLNNIPVADLICIFMGTNDYGHGTPMGQFAWDTADTDTSFYTALRKTFSVLKGKYPFAQIVWFTPLHRKSLLVDGQTQLVTDNTPNAQGLTLRDYVNTIKEVAAEYSISVVDLYSQCKLNPRMTQYVNQYMSDGLHPNSAGHKEIAKVAAAYLRSMTFNTQSIKVKKTLKEMDDTNITTPVTGQALVYDGTTQKWENKEAEADSSNVSYRGMSVEQALDEEYKPVENLVTDNTKIVDWFWTKTGSECTKNTSIPEFQSFYIPVEEGKTYYTAAKMNSLWIGYLDENEQAVDSLTVSGSAITIPTGQGIKYLSYPQRQAYKHVTIISEKPATFVGELDIYRMTSAGEVKMQYQYSRANGNYYVTDTGYTPGTPIWCADYTYNLEDSVIGIGEGFYILGVNTQDKTAITLNMSNKIYLFDIANNTFTQGDSPVTIPEEWKKNVQQHKTPSGLHGMVRVDDENNYILRAEGLSDFIIPKSTIKTRVESQNKVFEDYTTASGMVWYNLSTAYLNMGVFTARHRGPIVEKKSTEVDNHWYGKSWYAYGTSMTDASMNGYTVELQSLLGANLTNYGKGGSGIIPSLHGGTSGDNTYTRVKRTTDGKTNADLITLEIIPNDMSGTLGTPTDNYADGTTETFCGCLNELLQYLQVNTNAQIVVLIATRSRYNYQDPTTKYPPESENATKWLQWTDAAKECCRRNCVPFIDGQSNCGLGYARVSGDNKYVRDQIHLTALGAKNLGQYFYSQIKDIPLFYSA